MFGMLGVFGIRASDVIQARVKVGLERAKQEEMAGRVRRDARGRRLKAIGRPRVSSATEAAIRERLAAGVGMLTIAAQLGVGSGTVQRVKRELAA
jgi:DNA invertase Pin-like site-specific DNA recombinase